MALSKLYDTVSQVKLPVENGYIKINVQNVQKPICRARVLKFESVEYCSVNLLCVRIGGGACVMLLLFKL